MHLRDFVYLPIARWLELAVEAPYLCFGELFVEHPVVVACPMLATRSGGAGSASAASMLAIDGVAWVYVWKGERAVALQRPLIELGISGLVDFGEAATFLTKSF